MVGPPPPSLAPRPATLDELQRHYISGSGWVWLGSFARALPWSLDDLTAQFGEDLYDRMLHDPQIAACIQVMKTAVVEEGLTFSPAIKDEADPEYARAMAIRDEAEAQFTEMEAGSDDLLLNLLDALALGNKLAEAVYEYAPMSRPSPHLPRQKILRLVDLKVKPRRSYAYVVDGYMNVLGVLAQELNLPSPVVTGWMIAPENPPPNLINPEKIVRFAFRPRDADPRGTSILRAAYTPWWQKQQILKEHLAYIAQFAGGSIWGTTPDKAEDTWLAAVQAGGDPTLQPSPEQVMNTALTNFKNGAVVTLPYGTEIHVERGSAGATDPFLQGFGYCDLQITKAILTQSLATEEGAHSTRAAAAVHQDALDTIIRQAKRGLSRAVWFQILRRWVLWNWGANALHLTPQVGLGTTERHDLASMMTAIATLYDKGYPAPNQMPALDELLGLPVRDLTLADESAAGESQDSALDAGAGTDAAGRASSAPSPDPAASAPDTGNGKATFATDPVVPSGATDPLTPVPETVSDTPAWRKRAAKLFDALAPGLGGLLLAGTVTGKGGWSYDSTRQQYRNRATGKLLATARLVQTRNRLADHAAVVDRLAARLASGKLTVPAWESAMRDALADVYLAQFALGRGGLAALQPTDWTDLARLLVAQFAYLAGFAQAVATGELSEKAIAARARMYVGSSVQAFERARAEAWDLDLPAYPGDGSSECLSADRCDWLIEPDLADPRIVRATWDTQDDAKVCKTCQKRGETWAPLTLMRPDATFSDVAVIAQRLEQQERVIMAADEGEWRTINGAHVLIENGTVIKGPADLVGKKTGGKSLKPHEKPEPLNERHHKEHAHLTLTPAKERAFTGASYAPQNPLSKPESGRIGESVVLAYLKQIEKQDDARPANEERNNFPVDILHDHSAVEVKTGQTHIRPDAQKWRLTIGEPSKSEKAWLKQASAEEVAEHNRNKQADIVKRKERIIREVTEELGHPITARTITVALNHDKKLADVHVFDGFHKEIRWHSDQARTGYVGSFHYA